MAKRNEKVVKPRRTRLFNNSTGKWEYWMMEETPLHPWRFLRLGTLLSLRGLRKVLRDARPARPQELELDTQTLRMVSPKERRRSRFRRAADAVLSMVQMQRFIK